MDIVGVSRAKTSGSYVTKSGRKAYRGQRKHWYVYFYDDDGKFRKKMISALEVPYYGSLIRRTRTYRCGTCGTRFRSMRPKCPKCGSAASKSDGKVRTRSKGGPGMGEPGRRSSAFWTYQGTFIVDSDQSVPPGDPSV
jgi:hypothetical protein